MNTTKKTITKNDYSHLLLDHTPCTEIDTSGSASEHELGDLARLDGHSSLTNFLNEGHLWDLTVSQAAEILLKA